MIDIQIFYDGPIVNKADAMARGLKRYFTGKSCRYGHVAERYMFGGCIQCNKAKYNYAKKWRSENKKQCAEYNKKYASYNVEKLRAIKTKYRRKMNKTCVSFRLANIMRRSLGRSLGGGRQSSSFKHVDYTLEELKVHLERQFTKGMNWENQGEWHIDHVLPVSSFNITGPDCPEFKACWSLSNLRPLWAKDNLAKGSKVEFLL